MFQSLRPNCLALVLACLASAPSGAGELRLADCRREVSYFFSDPLAQLRLARAHLLQGRALMAFGIVTQYLAERGMVLVDTKTEHGVNADGQIVSADELYTMDSSRFWRVDENGDLLTRDGKPVSFSKEFARGMVKEKGQQFSDEQANEIAVRYIQGLQHLTGESFAPDLRPRDQRIVESTNLVLDALL